MKYVLTVTYDVGHQPTMDEIFNILNEFDVDYDEMPDADSSAVDALGRQVPGFVMKYAADLEEMARDSFRKLSGQQIRGCAIRVQITKELGDRES